jgi:hypothetical protein
MPRFTHPAALIAAAASIVIGCSKGETPPADSAASLPAPAASAAPNMVTFTAKEFAFDGPDTIPAGMTMIHMSSTCQELHHVQLLKLEQGKTFADLQAAVKAGGPPPTWAVPYGGVNPLVGGVAAATQMIEAGNYAVVCFVEGADHVPHLAKGMMKPLTVTPSTAAATEPTADVTLTLSDYTFTLSKPLAAGNQTIKVENGATQPHEVVLVQLEAGKSMEDLRKWATDFKGPPPGRPIGGIPAFMPGKTGYFEASLTPGDYGMICFVPDAKDGKMHVEHGMMTQFKIS